MENTPTKKLHLLEACWPVVEFVTNFVRMGKHGTTPAPEDVRYEALAALRDAEDIARDDPVTERAWHDRIKGIMVYLLDYKLINTEWDGRMYWLDNPFETDPTVLNHSQALGGEDFFITCDDMQREYELADRRDRDDRDELAEQLSVYFICLRLGFQGQYHDRPQELSDYTRRLFTRLPAYGTTRSKEMFPDCYHRNQELKIKYDLGMRLTIVLITLAFVVTGWLVASRLAWNSAVSEIRTNVERVDAQLSGKAAPADVDDEG